ncbi:MAG: NUDIX domain-containing protein [Oscillospiraceae bacterium]|nr:NUDIX domain-containing protein [Oscillospiraceae bacterium]
MDSAKVYETGLLYHHYANTAYPLTPKSFMQYKLKDDNEIRAFVWEEWKDAKELSLYIHIPFCKTRCKFCEYVVLEGTDDSVENEYVELLLREMEMYSEILKGKKIVGYDLGGGTPTKLSVENLKKITEAVYSLFDVEEGTVFSVETTPLIAANEPEKIKAVYDMGYKRISMGVQTVSEKLLSELGRDGSKSIYERAVANIRKAGFESFNIDLMYGFLHQSETDFDNTLHYAIGLNPEHITLYRNRYKGTKLEYEAGGVSIYKAMYQYRIAYRVLTENGYMANVGKNTFSKVKNDYGTSDYLTKRVIKGTPYVGMGLGAQSFGMNYLAYNLGAAEKRMERYRKAINEGKLPFQDIYRLPQDETIAKMVSVAFYFAFVDMDAFYKRFGVDFREKFAEEVKFVLDNGLMEIKENRIYLTERGSDYINGIIPLFYSERSKKELESAFAKKNASEKSDEELFLSAYNIEDYDRPSIATDIVVFSMHGEEAECHRKDAKQKLSLLLIKRGEHPFMNKWALPGGFLKANETIEECALREITEETNLTPVSIMPIGVFSEPDRDPRGRIVSNAFVSVVSEENVKVMSGDDAIAAKWFDVDFEFQKDGIFRLVISSGDEKIVAELLEKNKRFGKSEFEIISNDGLAFDHAKIIATSLSTLRNEAEKLEVAFDFLPERFTLASLQKVQEILTGETLLTANFRRKIAGLVEETEEYTEGVGHRPARLFKRKK